MSTLLINEQYKEDSAFAKFELNEAQFDESQIMNEEKFANANQISMLSVEENTQRWEAKKNLLGEYHQADFN